jgi:hypothetical protein
VLVALGERVLLRIKRLRRSGPQFATGPAGARTGDDRALAAERIDPQLGGSASGCRSAQRTFSIAMCSIPASMNARPRAR